MIVTMSGLRAELAQQRSARAAAFRASMQAKLDASALDAAEAAAILADARAALPLWALPTLDDALERGGHFGWRTTRARVARAAVDDVKARFAAGTLPRVVRG